jgi:hypothetical protein
MVTLDCSGEQDTKTKAIHTKVIPVRHFFRAILSSTETFGISGLYTSIPIRQSKQKALAGFRSLFGLDAEYYLPEVDVDNIIYRTQLSNWLLSWIPEIPSQST